MSRKETTTLYVGPPRRARPQRVRVLRFGRTPRCSAKGNLSKRLTPGAERFPGPPVTLPYLKRVERPSSAVLHSLEVRGFLRVLTSLMTLQVTVDPVI